MQSVTPVTYSIVNFLNAVISSLFFRNLMGGNNTEEKKKRGKKKKKKNLLLFSCDSLHLQKYHSFLAVCGSSIFISQRSDVKAYFFFLNFKEY